MEEVGVYREMYDMGFRGCVYRVYVNTTGSVLIYEHEWTKVEGESDRKTVKEFTSLDEAINTPDYTRVIANMYITEAGGSTEVWRECWANL